MSSKILYLLGAGASANALPLIKARQDEVKYVLPQALNLFLDQLQKTTHDIKSSTLTELQEIVSQSIDFGTPDLYAKFLLETGHHEKYQLLKKLLSAYFSAAQSPISLYPGIEYNKFDKRALAFLTMIADNKRIPENIKILSWNYDQQMEIAASKLRGKNYGKDEMIKGFSCFPNRMDGDAAENREKQPFLFHINGVAGHNYEKDCFIAKCSMPDFNTAKEETFLSFAWENTENDEKASFNENRVSKIKELAHETEILVVVGYSFPFFNRKIDTEIFKCIEDTLTKIYIQDRPNRVSDLARQVASQFNLSDAARDNIVPIAYTDNYHIPYEL